MAPALIIHLLLGSAEHFKHPPEENNLKLDTCFLTRAHETGRRNILKHKYGIIPSKTHAPHYTKNGCISNYANCTECQLHLVAAVWLLHTSN